MIDYDALRQKRFPPIVQSYTTRDTRLYALGLNIGANPLDPMALRFVADEPPQVVATMPMALARLGSWMREPEVGIDYRRMVVGEVALRLHASLPAKGRVRAAHRVVRVTDKGAGRGALVTVRRDLWDDVSGTLVAEFDQVSFCRGDGGFAVDGRHDPPESAPPWDPGELVPDLVLVLPTSPQQPLIYRLSGDMNELHSHPAVARQAGFERPILHGLATLGMAGHALDLAAAEFGSRTLGALRGRLTAPVMPGDTLRMDVWREAAGALFRVHDSQGREVIAMGRAEFH